MKLSQLRNRKWFYQAAAFAMPFTAIVVLMIAVGAVPFGNMSLLYSDMWHQYFPFFKAFREALLSGESLLYSWNVGMGMDYLGLIAYYLASPLNLLSVLIPESWVLPYFSLLMPVKLGLASVFFATFLKKLFHKNDFSIALFGSCYALCSWALGYQWNIMWLDTFALLPLVALGAVELLRYKKFVLYTVTLALSILSNYYIGFFTCIFVLLLFICYEICRCKCIKQFALDLCRIALFSALAIGLTAFLELPAFAALGDTYSSVNSFPDNFSLNIVEYADCAAAREAWEAFKTAKEAGESGTISLWFTAVWESIPPVLSGMRQVAGNIGGGVTPTFKEGLPNIYSGIAALMLALMFLTSGKVKLRDKICTGFLLLFFVLSFVIRQLDYIWHGFHFTNMIPYRFSFLFSFVVLYMAYRAFLMRDSFKLWQVLLSAGLALGLLMLSDNVVNIPAAFNALGDIYETAGQAVAAGVAGDKDGNAAALQTLQSLFKEHGRTYVFLVYNLVFFCLNFIILLYPRLLRRPAKDATMEDYRLLADIRYHRRRISTGLLSLVIVLELVMSVINFGVSFSYTNIENYPNGTTSTASMIRYMQEREKSLFYRAETTHTQTLNDGALNGYNGISTFTSSANVKVTDFMTALGYAARNNWNRYCFEESSPVANLFLNLKYMLERDGKVEENPYFNDVHHYNDVHLLENNAYLPLGFLANAELCETELRMSATNSFYNQNDMFRDATGIEENVWNILPGTCLEIDGKNVNFDSRDPYGFCIYRATGSGAQITYRYTIEEEGFLCLDINMSARNSFYVYLNNKWLFSESITLPQNIAVCQVRPGDVVEVRASCKADESSNMTIRAAQLNERVFWAGYDILNASTLELSSFSNTKITGSIDCNRDGVLYTSVPDDGNWRVKVDGKYEEIILIGEAMIGVRLREGVHEIEFIYENTAFTRGASITAVCLLVFLALVAYQYRNFLYRYYQRIRLMISK